MDKVVWRWAVAAQRWFAIAWIGCVTVTSARATEAWISAGVSPRGQYQTSYGYKFIDGGVYNVKNTPEPTIGVTYARSSEASVSLNGGASRVAAGYVMTLADSSSGKIVNSQSIIGSMPDIEMGDPYIGTSGSSAVFDTYFKAYEEGEISLSWDSLFNVAMEDGLDANGGVYVWVEKNVDAGNQRQDVYQKLYQTRSGVYQKRFNDEVVLPVEKDTYYHIHMSSGFSVRDFLDDTFFSYQSTSSFEFLRDSCTVQTLNPWKLPAPGDAGNVELPLTADMQTRVDRLQAALEKLDPNVNIDVTSGRRKTEFQNHFYDVKRVHDALMSHPDIEKSDGQFVASGDEGDKCVGVIGDVQQAMSRYQLTGEDNLGRLLVDHPDASPHVKGTAVDIQVDSQVLSQAEIDRVAGSLGIRLWRPYRDTDASHFELMTAERSQNTQIIGTSSVNLLVEDSQGRRLGYDPKSGAIVNDFGTQAYYSGPGSDPQVIELPPLDLLKDDYTISGVGSTDGGFAVRVTASDEGGVLFDEVVASGFISAHEAFDPLTTRLYYQRVFGDFTGEGALDIKDIDLLIGAMNDEVVDSGYDLNRDQSVDGNDLSLWVGELFGTYLGDANLDGEFNSADLVQAVASGTYEDNIVGNSDWSSGDWDGNGDFTTTDLVVALAGGGYEQGVRSAVAAVPEPSAVVLAVLAILCAIAVRRTRSNP